MCVCICLSRERAYPFIFRIFLSVFPFLRRIHSGTNRVFPVWWMTESSFVPSPTDKRRFSLFSTFLQFYIFLVSFFFSPPSKSEAHFLHSLMFQKNESKATSWTETVIAMMAYVGLSSTMWMRMTRKRKKKWATEAKDDKKKASTNFIRSQFFAAVSRLWRSFFISVDSLTRLRSSLHVVYLNCKAIARESAECATFVFGRRCCHCLFCWQPKKRYSNNKCIYFGVYSRLYVCLFAEVHQFARRPIRMNYLKFFFPHRKSSNV